MVHERMSHDGQRLDYDQISPLIFIGTNTCCTTHFAKELLEKGVRADISLEETRVDMPLGVDFYVWLPTADHAAPSPEKLAFGVDALRFFVDHKIPCYVHCKNGHGRAPTLVAAYLIKERKMSVDEAVAVVRNHRSGAHIEPEQMRALADFERTRRR